MPANHLDLGKYYTPLFLCRFAYPTRSGWIVALKPLVKTWFRRLNPSPNEFFVRIPLDPPNVKHIVLRGGVGGGDPKVTFFGLKIVNLFVFLMLS